MAKILDKKRLQGTGRIVNIRQAYDWAKTEYETLAEKYGEKKEKLLNRFIAKSNKKLLGVAYKACDKIKYIEEITEQKIKKFDAKNYLQYRKAHHTASRAIFQAIREGKTDWTDAIVKMREERATLLSKREQFVARVNADKQAYIAKNTVTDATEYNTQVAKLEQARTAYSKEIDQKHAVAIEKEKARLSSKMEKLLEKIKEEKAKYVTDKKLPQDVILSVRGLKMYFGGLKAVDDLDFDVKKGEIFGLIGPNGAGKTTVFNCITQFYKPTAGELLFETKEGEVITLTDYKVHDIILNGIARTFQNVEVVKEVTVLENLLIAATRNYTSSLFTQMLHLPKLKREERAIRARADKVLKYMDLFVYRERLCWGLPYGVLKRLEIARALMTNPQLIILDEPAAGLNESETTELANMINKIRKDFDCTILLVEHDMSLVMNVCDHICAISFGKKLAYGTPEEVQSNKQVQEAYLGVAGED